MTDIDPIQAENMLLGIFEDGLTDGDGSFFEHAGLPRDASWGQFRRHYDTAGMPDAGRAAGDLATYPPIANRIAELRAEKESKVVSLRDRLECRTQDARGDGRTPGDG